MEFGEVLSKRRMVRHYTEQPVSREALNRLVEAGRRAPSAGFSQGQAFVVVTDRTDRQAIARLSDEDRYLAAGFDSWISQAPAHIVICTSEKAYRLRYQEADKSSTGAEPNWPVPYWWVDAGAALQNILLAAVDEGLAAGFLGSHALPGLADLLDIPADYQPIGLVTVGHPAPDRRSSSLDRGWRPKKEIIHWNRWLRPDPPS
ncbi:MAG: nitroreductase family protein [bacterium]|nr:nitroreductase family protein [bacterium]